MMITYTFTPEDIEVLRTMKTLNTAWASELVARAKITENQYYTLASSGVFDLVSGQWPAVIIRLSEFGEAVLFLHDAEKMVHFPDPETKPKGT